MSNVALNDVQAIKENLVALLHQVEKIEKALTPKAPASKVAKGAKGIAIAERNAAKRYS